VDYKPTNYAEPAIFPCSAELISTAYQPWNSVFLSQQISYSRLISQKIACRTGPLFVWLLGVGRRDKATIGYVHVKLFLILTIFIKNIYATFISLNKFIKIMFDDLYNDTNYIL
jgi:hypothetical protein